MPVILFLAGGALVVVAILLLARRRPAGSMRLPEPGELGHEAGRVIAPGTSVGFGYKVGWVAVKGVPAQRVMEVLALHKVAQVEWSEGIERAYDSAWVFVTPVLSGWVLVVGNRPWDLAVDESRFQGLFDQQFSSSFERAAALLQDWSRRLETVVLGFYTHRVPEAHAWIACSGGVFERLFWYVGQDGEAGEKGTRTKAEGTPTLQKRLEGSLKPTDDEEWETVGEEDVMAVAGAWSIDPTRIEEDHPRPGPGWIGKLPT